MKVKVAYTELPTVLKTQNFSILVTSPCFTDILTISTTNFATPALTYNVKDAVKDLIWLDSDATSTYSLTTA